MILPTKHLSRDRALLTQGARLLAQLARPKTVSALWDEVGHLEPAPDDGKVHLSYDTFVLALDLLFLMGAIELHDGLLNRRNP